MAIEQVVGAIVALVTACGGVYVAALRARRLRKSDPPPRALPARHVTPPSPAPITRVEHEAMAHRVVALEDAVRKLADAERALDRRIDEEVKDRLRVGEAINRESARTNERLAEITGRMAGLSEAGALGPRSWRRQ